MSSRKRNVEQAARSTAATDRSADPRIEMLRCEALMPYPGNARIHSRKQVRQIADSIGRFGFTNPVLIDDGNMILAGHGRVEAAKLLAMDRVPCVQLRSMTEAQKRAYILADNKLALNAGWDEDLLGKELGFLLEQTETLDIALTGFSIAEIDLVLEPGGTAPQADTEREDALPSVADDTAPVTRAGDVWQLGPHRLVCGDARDAATYASLMQDERGGENGTAGGTEVADMVFTDPPYNVPVDGHVCGSGKVRHREFAFASGEMSQAQFTAFLIKSLQQLAEHSRDGSIHFVCMDWRHMRELMEAGEAVYSEMKNLIVWAKDNGGMGTFYRSRHELIFAFKKGTAAHTNTFELGQHGRYRTNVWNYRGITSATRQAREELALHPTVKPVAMLADALKDCCPRGGIVLDAFAGSGSIVIAAHKTGRRARAVEIDALYCDTIIRRWQAYAKDDAVLLETNETFDEVANDRMAMTAVKGPRDSNGDVPGDAESSKEMAA
ncbi:DNA methyltransferase [Aurantimonas sp. C2-6-R+9]|uniref:site-specific DNA-methyltransferase n=1 Tax=unclassified Aurantimonas TaxID=2638230 RepID=UPI002E17CEA5|nr:MULTISPECIES: DNA methyltransferase [unclassified Aurantimonas]MEC5291823.1 DNA methyltransferase [Aurantimonas sp. C2-3-R2]MEC5382406.1 DNA methyltransferase [Aurantimonas sp. C2-6-R+9]MEC5412890.1 DNA methyltransferase [Aurantimonas sp. C2-4-R8]